MESRRSRAMGAPISVRLARSTEERVRQIAALEHRSYADTIRLLTEEAIKGRDFPEVVFTEGPTGRRATLRNGPDVWEVIEPFLLAGRDWAALRESFPHLDESTLRTALRYFERFPEEIEARVALNQAS
jgi:uncharacterized protein (DUF433 family)